jgi:hypothetical protein
MCGQEVSQGRGCDSGSRPLFNHLRTIGPSAAAFLNNGCASCLLTRVLVGRVNRHRDCGSWETHTEGRTDFFSWQRDQTLLLSPLEEPLGPGVLGSDVMIEYHCVLGRQVLVTRRAGMASAFPKHNQAAAGQGGWEIGCKWKFFSSGLWGRQRAGHPVYTMGLWGTQGRC